MAKPHILLSLRSGDILAYKDGQSRLSRLIRWGTNSRYSHVACYLGTNRDIRRILAAMMEQKSYIDRGLVPKLREIYEQVAMTPDRDDELVIESDFSFRKIFSLEGYSTGVKVTTLSSLMSRSGSHDVYRIRNFLPFEKDWRRIALTFAASKVKYDFAGLIWQAVIAAKLRFLKRPAILSVNSISRMYCSEFTRRTQVLAGVRPEIDGLTPEQTTPETETIRPDVKFEGTI